MRPTHRSRGGGKSKALAMVLLLILVAGCDLIKPGAKGHKVTKVRGTETMMVLLKEGSAFSGDEYAVVRLQGYVAPPPASPYYREAFEFMREMVEGKYVVLEYDGEKPMSTDLDEILGYVFVDGKLLNEELIRRGLGRFGARWGPLRYVEEMKSAQEEARQAKRGMWEGADE